MGDWNEMLERQKEERVSLFQSKIDMGLTPSQTARALGMSRQSVYQFCKVHDLEFTSKDNVEKITSVLDEETFGVDDPDRFSKDADGNTVVVARVGDLKP